MAVNRSLDELTLAQDELDGQSIVVLMSSPALTNTTFRLGSEDPLSTP